MEVCEGSVLLGRIVVGRQRIASLADQSLQRRRIECGNGVWPKTVDRNKHDVLGDAVELSGPSGGKSVPSECSRGPRHPDRDSTVNSNTANRHCEIYPTGANFVPSSNSGRIRCHT